MLTPCGRDVFHASFEIPLKFDEFVFCVSLLTAIERSDDERLVKNLLCEKSLVTGTKRFTVLLQSK